MLGDGQKTCSQRSWLAQDAACSQPDALFRGGRGQSGDGVGTVWVGWEHIGDEVGRGSVCTADKLGDLGPPCFHGDHSL